MSRKKHKPPALASEVVMSDPVQALVLDTIADLRAALVRARQADLLSAEDLAEVRRVLYPAAEVVNDWQTWYADVGKVKQLLGQADQRGRARLPQDRAEELARIASEEDSAANVDQPDMGSTAD